MKNRTYLFIALSVVYGVLALITPPLTDDLVYMGDSFGIDIGFEKFAAGFAELKRHYVFDVGRLSNAVAVVFLCLLPRWVFAVFQSFAIYVILEYGSRIAGLKKDSLLNVVYAILFVFTLPWHDSIAVLDYSVNYVWPTALIVGMLYLTFISDSRNALPAKVLLAFAAGWMHEGFSVPICVGLCAAMAYNWQVFIRFRLAILIVFIAGTCMNFIFPAIWYRASTVNHPPLDSLKPISLIITFMAYTSLVAVAILWKKTEDKKRRTLLVMMTAATLSALGIYYFTGLQRAAWIPQVYGILCFLIAVNGHFPHPKASFSIVISIASALMMLASLGLSIYWTVILRKEYYRVVAILEKTPADHIFYDPIIVPVTHEIMTCGRVKTNHFRSRIDLMMFGKYYCNGKLFKVLPHVFKNADFSSLPETTEGSGLRLLDGHVVSTPDVAKAYMETIYPTAYVTFADGTRSIREVVAQPFRDKNGQEWVYLLLPRRYGIDTTKVVSIEPIL